jgi:DNA-binding NarL/FixJ family response regulator
MKNSSSNDDSFSGAPPGSKTWKTLIVDDHPVFRHGLSQLVGSLKAIEICGEADNAMSALDVMRRVKPDLALVDISMPGISGLELVKSMLAEQPRLIVLVVSMHDESLFALRALRAGAKGYITKQQGLVHILDAVNKVLSGGIYVSPQFSERLVFKAIQSHDTDLGLPVDNLSDRELEVLEAMGRGLSTREIANTLHLSVKTVETHRAHIKEKLGFKTSDEMTKFAGEWMVLTGD